MKDLIIVDGRNHVATDIEATTDAAAEGTLNIKGMAAFAASAADVPESATERTGHGIDRKAPPSSSLFWRRRIRRTHPRIREALLQQVRTLIARRHGLQPADFLVLARQHFAAYADRKVKRLAAGEAYTAGEYD